MLTTSKERFFEWCKRRPRQLDLPFWCGHYGLNCGPFYRLNSGFYGRCVNCGVTYDPVNDR